MNDSKAGARRKPDLFQRRGAEGRKAFLENSGASLRPAMNGRLAHENTFVPLFFGDWVRAVFMHYEVDAELLQREVPFRLDLWEGKAFVSLVAFTMQRLRPRFGGLLGELVFKLISSTRFLNVRTYVTHRNEPGIYFIAEFLSNRLCVPLGPPTFGLPYRAGHLAFRHDHEHGVIEGLVESPGSRCRLAYRAMPVARAGFQACPSGTLDSFLLERYAAFTRCRNKHRSFHIGHPPWPQARTEMTVQDEGLLATTGEWGNPARRSGGPYSPGVRNVRMGPPCRIPSPERPRRLTVFFDV